MNSIFPYRQIISLLAVALCFSLAEAQIIKHNASIIQTWHLGQEDELIPAEADTILDYFFRVNPQESGTLAPINIGNLGFPGSSVFFVDQNYAKWRDFIFYNLLDDYIVNNENI